MHAEWFSWIQSHVLEVLNTGKFTSAKLTQVLVEDDNQTKTYSIQYTANSRQDLDAYYKENAQKLQHDTLQKFGDKMLAFRTELKVIKEFYPTSVGN